MGKVFICRNWFPEELQRIVRVHDTKIWMEESNPPGEVLLEEVREIDGLICLGSDDINAEAIRGAHRLKIISSFSTGVNNIDIAAATSRKIPVVHPPHVLTETTADLAFALILAAARVWRPSGPPSWSFPFCWPCFWIGKKTCTMRFWWGSFSAGAKSTKNWRAKESTR